MKLLIGYDGSSHADSAIADLRHAGLPEQVEALVMSVADLPFGFPGAEHLPSDAVPSSGVMWAARSFASEALVSARQLARDGMATVHRLFPAWRVSADSVADSPHKGLVERAEHWQADLVLVGTQGRGAIGRFVLGSVSQNVLSQAPCSVRIGRDLRAGDDQPLRIMLAFDGSSDSAAAAQVVAARAWPAGAEVRVVSVVNPHLAIALAASAADRREDHRAGVDEVIEQAANAVVQSLTDHGVRAHCRIIAGEPKRILLEQAEIWSAHSLFLGARGHTRLERFLLGSVSSAMAARADCTVEVVRPLHRI